MARSDFGIRFRALMGFESECGDIAVIKEYDNQCFIALIDVLGHGIEARKVAILAKSYLEHRYEDELTKLMNGLHEHLKGTRGAVAAICHLDILNGKLEYVGIGNITVRIFGAKSRRFIPEGGVVGYIIAKPRKNITKLHNGDILIMYSDGIKEHFDEFECDGLLKENAEKIADGIIRKFGKENDDASCVVLKYFV